MIHYRILLIWMMLLAFLAPACTTKKDANTNQPFAAPAQVAMIDSIMAQTTDENVTDETIILIKQQLALFPPEKDEATHQFLALSLAELYNFKGDFDSSISRMEAALPYYEANTHIGTSGYRQYRALFICYYIYGKSLMEQGENITKANYYLSKASSFSLLPEVDSVMEKPYQITALQYAMTTNRFCKQYEQALRYGRSALQLIRLHATPAVTYTAHSFRITSEIANCFSETDQFDSCKKYIAELEQQSLKINQPQATHDLYSVKAAYFYYAEQYDSSLKYSLLSTSSGRQDDLESMISSANNLGLCVRLKRKEEARYWYLLAEEKFKLLEIIDASDKIAYFENKIPYEFLYGDKNIAERDYWELAKLKETEYGNERLKMFAAIESEYNVAAKEKKISLLNTQNEIARDRQKSLSLIVLLSCLLTGTVTIAAILLIRQRKLKQEKEKALLQQQLLRTQMEPHFIFNTLSALQSFVRFDEKEKTLKYLNQFSRLLRSSLELSRESLVPLTEEMETLENYLSLQKMRYDNGFSYRIHCDEDIYGLLIPPMLIQPFVENAIVHGIDPNNSKGLITIDFLIKAKQIEVTIKDNGKGIQPSSPSPQHKSLATTISRERLAMMARQTGIAAGISINNGTINGTVVVLTIPVQQEPEVSNKN